MQINRAYIENFLTIGLAEISLSDRGLLLIQGENQDDSSTDSNGAGKSSIPDAICWCLYGETAREVSGDAVVNETAKKDCKVILDLQDDTTTYQIIRHRKHSTGKNRVQVFQQVSATTTQELTKGTDKETQLVIDRIMGCSLAVFRNANYAGQEAMPNLPGMTDKELKLLIEEAAGTAIMDQAHVEARARAQQLRIRLDEHLGEQTSLKRRIQDADDQIDATNAGRKVWDDAQQAKVDLQKNAIINAVTAFRAVQAELAKIDEPTLNAEKAGLEEQVTNYDKLLIEQRRLDSVAATRHRELGAHATLVQDLGASMMRVKKDISTLQDTIGTPCKSCNKPYCEEDIAGVRKIREEELEDLKKRGVAASQKLKDLKAQYEEATQDATNYEKTLPVLTNVNARRSEIERELAAAAAHRSTMQRHNRDATAAKERRDELKAEPNPADAHIESLSKMKAAREKELVACEALIGAAQTKVEIAEAVVKVFGPAGVRAHILDTVTPFLNDRTADYLSALSDGNVHATWSTLTKTTKGELREKFAIEVTNDKGAKSFKGLSGGEKRKVRIATYLALQDLVATRAVKPVNIFVADEVDHALDQPGLERLMTLLERKARDRGTVLVISHNSLADWCDQIVTVTKAGGKATVSGAV